MKNKNSLFFLTVSAVFVAIIAVMCFTQIGYLKFGIIEITLISIPVAFGGAILGKWGGLLLGAAFGISSFIQCFGFSAFGAALLSINPFWTFVVCLLPRMIAGFVSALTFELKRRGIGNIFLWCDTATVGFYERLGYKEVSKIFIGRLK